MRYYLYINNAVVGPYAPLDMQLLLGGIADNILVYPESGPEAEKRTWRKASEFQELADCIKAGRSEAGAKADGSPVGLRSLDVLSTDDDSSIRALLWHLLTDAGHKVEFARDGEEVFARLEEKRYDLLILDVNMPKMNGYKVSELVHKRYSRPPRVMIFTGRNIQNEQLQFVCSEADAILNKATDTEKIIPTIEDLFREKEAPVAGAAVESFTPEPAPVSLEDFRLPGAAASSEPSLRAEVQAEIRSEAPAEVRPEVRAEVQAASANQAEGGVRERLSAAEDKAVRQAESLADISSKVSACEAALVRARSDLGAISAGLLEVKKASGNMSVEIGQLELKISNAVKASLQEQENKTRRSYEEVLRREKIYRTLSLLCVLLAFLAVLAGW